MKEYQYDKVLHINTRSKQMEVNNSVHYHPYEPTPYTALEELFNQYEISEQDTIVDFGCGKGRLNFFIHYKYYSNCVGIDMNEHFLDEAIKNAKNYFKNVGKNKGAIHFHRCLAEKYEIQPEENKFYFFNPFSVQVFMKVFDNILLSYEKTKRDIDLIFYYPSDDYQYFLETQSSFQFMKEIMLSGLYEKNPYEKFLIYRLTK